MRNPSKGCTMLHTKSNKKRQIKHILVQKVKPSDNSQRYKSPTKETICLTPCLASASTPWLPKQGA